MILTALNDYYERLRAAGGSGISAPGDSLEKISYALVLDATGALVAVNDLRELSGRNPAPKPMCVPQPLKRTANVQPNRLWDKTSYVLGVSASSKRTDEEHDAFKALHLKLLADSDDPGLRALRDFIAAWTPSVFAEDARFKPEMLDANLVFRLDERGNRGYIHERPAARALLQRGDDADDASGIGLCLVTGQHLPLARLHPAIKGVNGAQSSGASIVSFNLDAFKSYGKDQGENAPISEQAAFGYTTALNHLLRRDPDNRQRLQIGDATVVFWATAADDALAQAAETLFDLLIDPPNDGAETERLRNVLDQVRALEARPDLDPGLAPGTRLHVLGLAPNASRLSIRFWLNDDMRRFAERLGDHYRDIDLQPAPWKTSPPLWRLLLATAPSRDGKDKSEDVPPQLAGELARAILVGTAYPQSLLYLLVMRMRADHDVSDIRVALCKAVLARRSRLYSHNRSPPVSLDTANTEHGYVLGRLFSLLENAQRAALGDKLNATIRDRYYGAASATPASVFPVLLRNAQHHLSRLRKDKPGLAVNIEKDIGDTIAMLDAFPRSLRIEAQGLFAIGYYHQTQARFARGNAPGQSNHADTGEE